MNIELDFGPIYTHTTFINEAKKNDFLIENCSFVNLLSNPNTEIDFKANPNL
jgi:hypothetical protein